MKIHNVLVMSLVVGMSLIVAQVDARASELDFTCTSSGPQASVLTVTITGNQAVLDQDGSSVQLLSDGNPGCYENYGDYGCGRNTTLCVNANLVSGAIHQGQGTFTVDGNYGCGGWTSIYTCVSE